MNLSKRARIEPVITPTAGAAGTTTINGAVVDTADCDGVLFIVTFGAILAGAVTAIRVQQGQQANLADAADLAGSGQSVPDTADDRTYYVDVHRPRERYLRLVVTRGTANATVASAVAVKYGLRRLPASQPATVAGELHVSPAEGAA
jgi:hypothetical protein